MANTASVYLPLNSWVHIRAFTNAYYNQQVIISYEDGTSRTLTGKGEQDTPMPNGDYIYNTPATSQNPYLGYRVTVTMNSDNGNGQWQPSSVQKSGSLVENYSLYMVVSEDLVDQDWNDSVVLFSWWTPPTMRNKEDLRK